MLQNFGTALSREQMKNVMGGNYLDNLCGNFLGIAAVQVICMDNTCFATGSCGEGAGYCVEEGSSMGTCLIF